MRVLLGRAVRLRYIADDVDGLRLAGLGLALGASSRRRPPARPSSRPAARRRPPARPGPSRRPVPAGRRARWRRRSRACCSALKMALRMWAISPRKARASLRRLGRDELQHHRQVVGQLAFGQVAGRPSRRSAPGRSWPGRGRASRRAHARTGAARWRGRGRTARRSAASISSGSARSSASIRASQFGQRAAARAALGVAAPRRSRRQHGRAARRPG